MQNLNDPVSKSTASGASTPKIRLTVFESEGKRPLSKTLTLEKDDLRKKLSPPMTAGEFQTVEVDSLDEYMALIQDRTVCGPHRMCCYGVRPAGREDKGFIDTEKAIKEGKARPEAIARTKENFPWPTGPAIMSLDFDAPEGMSITPQLADQALCKAAPWLKDVRRAYIPSASSEIYCKSSGKRVSTKNGVRGYIVVDDGTKIPEIGNALFMGLVETGFGSAWVSESGAVQIRAWIDRTVYKPNQPDFAFGPHIPKGQGLEQRGSPVFFGSAPMLVTSGLDCDDYDEWEKTSPAVQKLRNSQRVQDESKAKRQAWMQVQSKRAIERATKAGTDTSHIEETYNRALQQGADGSYPLHEDFVLHGPQGTFTVKDALADPTKYHKMKIDNPFEPGTGRNKTLLYTLDQTHGPAIHCYAHGGMTFRLVRDSEATKENLAILDGLDRPSWLSDFSDADNEDLRGGLGATRRKAEEPAEDAGVQAGTASASTNQAPVEDKPLPKLKIKSLKGSKLMWPVVRAEKDGSETVNPVAIANVATAARAAAGVPRYDEFTDKLVITANGVNYPKDRSVDLRIWKSMQEVGVPTPLRFMQDALDAESFSNRFDSGKDFFENLPDWDGVVRAESLFIDHFGAADVAYTRALARLFFACLVRRGTGREHKCDEMVVLAGPQNLGKSTIFKYLVGSDRFSENLKFGDATRTVLEQTLGKLVVEMSELNGMSRADRGHILNFLSRTHDEGSLKYDRAVMNRGRRFTFIGTVNIDKPIPNMLKEDRRFLIMPVNKTADLMQVKRDRLQILAEAKEIEKQYGPVLELPQSLRSAAVKLRGAVVARGPHEASLERAFGGLADGRITATDVYRYLGFKSELDVGKFTSANGDAVGAFMGSMGWAKQRPRKDGKQVVAFVKGTTGPWYEVTWPHGPGSIAEIVEETVIAGSLSPRLGAGATGMPGNVIPIKNRPSTTP